MVVVIDNYDSFVYNLVHYVGELGAPVTVFRNDAVTLTRLRRLNPSALILSPGPGRPSDAGICIDLIRALAGRVPILGVCLGHQAIAEAFGGRVISCGQVVHGKTSQIHHDGQSIFRRLANPFPATRYHSLIVQHKTLPSCLAMTAWTDDGIIMGIRHRTLFVEGVQFHPESILTRCGMRIMRNFLRKTDRFLDV